MSEPLKPCPDELRGTYTCPYCGLDTPHSHPAGYADLKRKEDVQRKAFEAWFLGGCKGGESALAAFNYLGLSSWVYWLRYEREQFRAPWLKESIPSSGEWARVPRPGEQYVNAFVEALWQTFALAWNTRATKEGT